MNFEELIIPIELDEAKLKKSVDASQSILDGFQNKAVGGLSTMGGGVVAGITTGVAAGVEIIYEAVQAAGEAEQVQIKLNTEIKNGHTILGMTIDDYNNLADVQSMKTGLDDEEIGNLESILALNTNLNKDTYPEAISLAEDLSVAQGTDLASAGETLNKILGDTMQAEGRLNRAGIILSEEEKARYEDLKKNGTEQERANFLLGVMRDRYGGVAEAAGNTFAGALNKLKIIMGNILETIGGKLLPVLQKMAEQLIAAFNRPEVQAAIQSIADGVANFAQAIVDKIPVAIQIITDVFNFLMNNKAIVAGIFAALTVAVVTFAVTAGAAIWGMVAPLLPVIAVLTAIIAVVALVYQAWTNNWGGIRDWLTSFWSGTLQPIFKLVVDWLQVNIPKAIRRFPTSGRTNSFQH